MSYPADYGDAHLRHWDDAELLFGEGRWSNADQLYGFSAECGLKEVMRILGMPVDSVSGKPIGGQYLKHVQDIWGTFLTFAEGRDGAYYVAMLPAGRPFDDWSIDDRYAHSRHFSQQQVELHREAAGNVKGMVEQARQDGRL